MSIFEKFKSPDTDAKPMLRWWFPDAGADPERVASQVREIYEGGFGGVEVALVPQYTSFDAAEYGWGTHRWRNLMKVILKAARELPEHFKVDFTITAHWPPALNTICPNDDAHGQTIVCAWQKLGSANPDVLPLPMPETRTNDSDAGDAADYIFADTFVALTVGKVHSVDGNKVALYWDSMQDFSHMVTPVIDPSTGQAKWTPAGIPEHETKFGDWPKLRDRQYYYQVDGNVLPTSGNESSEIGPGDWLLFAFYRRGTGQSLSGREMEAFQLWLPMSPKMYAVNYYNRAGTEAIINFWEENLLCDEELVSLMRENKGAIFEDSIESAGIWAPELPKRFKERNGYSLAPYLPFIALRPKQASFFRVENTDIVAVSDNGNHLRVMEDYNKTLGDMYLENHLKPLIEWTKSFGYEYRAQSYGGEDIETCEAALVLDIAEGESLGFGDDYDNFRNIAGGVHITGRKFVSDEICADLLKAYGLTWQSAADTFNRNFAAEANRGVIHGAAYDMEISGKNNHWPGWHAFQFAFADPWGRRHPYWERVNNFTRYVSRTQAVLQNGTAKVDLLIYEKSRVTGRPCLTELLDRGYTYDVCGNGAILHPNSIVGPNGRLAESGPAYGAVIVRQADTMPVEVAKKLHSFAEKGLPVILLECVPGAVTGYDSDGSKDARLREIIKDLCGLPKVKIVKTSQELVPALKALGVEPALSYAAPGVLNVRRVEEDKSEFYFIFNSSREERVIPIDRRKNLNAYILDAWTGEVFVLNAEKLDLYPGEAKILVKTHADMGAGLRNYPSLSREVMQLDDWHLLIESWGPGGDEKDPQKPRKTLLPIGLVKLLPWDEMPVSAELIKKDGAGSMENVSGIGSYKKIFTLDKVSPMALVMEGGDDMILSVTVNGVPQPAADQSTRMVRLRNCLRVGENAIEIRIASTLKRRVLVENPFFSPDFAAKMFAGMPDPGPPAHAAHDDSPANRYGLIKVTLRELIY
ncbi:MAG: glycosyl hydrolase [Oscillospiraceae bacterium]|jgi:hypothetical protein